jgi:ketosteroid isomerase-like protein
MLASVDEHRVVWELEQRRLITETLLDYCEYVDRNDPATLVRKVFAPDGCFELGSRHAVVGREELAKMFAKTLAAFTHTSHHLSNVRITFDGDDAADSTSYVYAWHQTLEGRRVEVWGRYHDKLRLGSEGWRITSRHLSMAGFDGWESAPFELIARHANPSDAPSPVVQRRAAL